MHADLSRTRRNVALRALSIASCASLVTLSVADARTTAAQSAYSHRLFLSRAFVAQTRPLHIRTFGLRNDSVGDTPYSHTYYKVTNITAEVHGNDGYAMAVNNDGRIAYSDRGPEFDGKLSAYIVNNGGTFGKLVRPKVRAADDEMPLALNENGEVVGYITDGSFEILGSVAWSLIGATGSTVAYANLAGVLENAVNDHQDAVGWANGPSYSIFAVAVDGASKPPGRIIRLRGTKGEPAPSVDAAEAINDAGEIVGLAGPQAVRFSMTGYAQPIAGGAFSAATSLNERGDIVGYAGYKAFLYSAGKTVYLPEPSNESGAVAVAMAYGVNASDEVVGDLDDSNYNPITAFLYSHGRSYDLNNLIAPNSGWQILDAYGINDHGEIVGDGYYNGTLMGVSLKPPV